MVSKFSYHMPLGRSKKTRGV